MARCVTAAVVSALMLCLCCGRASCKRQICEVLVRIDSGPVCGRVWDAGDGTQYYSFRGIPYGKPPVGARRFQELEPLEHWEEPLFATTEGPACPQQDFIYGHIPVQERGQSDDCIYVNVHVPRTAVLEAKRTHNYDCHNKSNRAGLSILISIHGGAYNVGSGNSDLYGPEYLILEEVIVITFNSRLNVFGFLSLNTPKIPGNAGLRDMVTLLRWVQRNARAFGGNPDDVTLLGQGAGATSAHLLSMSEAAKGLFRRIVLLSGNGIPNFYAASPKYAKTIADVFLKAVGINSTDPEIIHQELIEMPLNKIMNANGMVQYETGLLSFVPVVEDRFPGITRILDDEPMSLIGQGRGKDIPIWMSFTSNDMEMAKSLLTYLNILERINKNPTILLPQRIVLAIPHNEALELADKVMNRYFNGTPTIDKYISSINDVYFKYPTFKLAEWRAAMGGAPVYMSEYAYESDFSVLRQGLWMDYMGATHAEDLTYLFHANSILGPNVSYRPQNQDGLMKDWMTMFIVNFIRCSNPTCTDDNASQWPPVNENKLKYNKNSEPMVVRMTEPTVDDRDMIEFFDSIDQDARDLSEMLKGRS